MSLFNASTIDYPVIIVTTQLGTAPDQIVGNYGFHIVRYPSGEDSAQAPSQLNAEHALIEHIKDFFSLYDFSVDFGEGVSSQNLQIIRYDEIETEITSNYL